MISVELVKILENLETNRVEPAKVEALRRRKCLSSSACLDEAWNWIGQTYSVDAFRSPAASLKQTLAARNLKRRLKAFFDSDEESFSFGEERSLRNGLEFGRAPRASRQMLCRKNPRHSGVVRYSTRIMVYKG